MIWGTLIGIQICFLVFIGPPSVYKSTAVKKQVLFLNELNNVEVKTHDMIPKIPSNFYENFNTFVALHEPNDFDIGELHYLAETWDSLIHRSSINMSICCTQGSFEYINDVLKSRSLAIFWDKKSGNPFPESLDKDLYNSLVEDLKSISQIEGGILSYRLC